jgi:hypothetical protein
MGDVSKEVNQKMQRLLPPVFAGAADAGIF